MAKIRKFIGRLINYYESVWVSGANQDIIPEWELRSPYF